MKIAVTYDNGNIFQHFGKTKQFKIYEIEDGNIISSEIVDTNGTGHGALAVFLKALRVKVLICGGIGAGAQNALADAKIELTAESAAAPMMRPRLTQKENCSLILTSDATIIQNITRALTAGTADAQSIIATTKIKAHL